MSSCERCDDEAKYTLHGRNLCTTHFRRQQASDGGADFMATDELARNIRALPLDYLDVRGHRVARDGSRLGAAMPGQHLSWVDVPEGGELLMNVVQGMSGMIMGTRLQALQTLELCMRAYMREYSIPALHTVVVRAQLNP